jgi:hypothetical protein
VPLQYTTQQAITRIWYERFILGQHPEDEWAELTASIPSPGGASLNLIGESPEFISSRPLFDREGRVVLMGCPEETQEETRRDAAHTATLLYDRFAPKHNRP